MTSAAPEIVTTHTVLDAIDLKHLPALTGQPESRFPVVLVKELIDNAIDAAERAGCAPQVVVEVLEDDSGWFIAVGDNGPGLTAEVLAKVTDFGTRASSKEWRRAPTRGQQGNAFKTLVGIPVAYARRDQPHERTFHALEVASLTGCWDVVVHLGNGRLESVVREKPAPGPAVAKVRAVAVEAGFSLSTVIACRLPAIELDSADLRELAASYAAVNPHLDLILLVPGSTDRFRPTRPAWRPQFRSSIHWYTSADFARFCDAARQLDWTASKLVGSFAGLTAKAAIRDVLSACAIAPRTRVVELTPQVQAGLLAALRAASPEAGPDTLTEAGRAAGGDGDQHKPRYQRIPGSWRTGDAVVPFVVEATLFETNDNRGEVVTAINYSPTYTDPFPSTDFEHDDDRLAWLGGDSLSAYLGAFHIDEMAPARIVLHVICPRLEYCDRGKSTISAPPELASAVSEVIHRVARPFALREDAHRRQHQRQRVRRTVKKRPDDSLIEIAEVVIPLAYHAARGRFSFVRARQVFYKARPLFQRYTSEELKDSYFLQTLLPGYLREHPEKTADWTILYDARGHLWEPHGGRTIALGTENVSEYLARRQAAEQEQLQQRFRYDTEGPGDRYGTVLFVEKEGFTDLFFESGLLDEFDVALMSTKGTSTTAARTFLQKVNGRCTLLALHDFDVAGMSIVGTLSRDTKRFQFDGEAPDIIDIGLRLDDVREHNLPAEQQELRTQVAARLFRNGATEDEAVFLAQGKRVELNAFGNDEFVDWVRSKLEQHAGKVIPDRDMLEAAWADAQRERRRRDLLEEVERQVSAMEIAPPPPDDLRGAVSRLLKDDPSQCWDDAIWSASSATVPTVDDGDE